LSREDGDKYESDSITNQKAYVADYARKEGFKIIEEYVDDGYTGTNFDRPSFQRLIDDIHNGKINCIIVKDLSRFGRNYIDSGMYIETIFPSLGVRLIAINDNFDSFDERDNANHIIVPFKNLINDAYCRDISIKIRTQLDMKRRQGKYISSFPLYGYLKDPEDHNRIVIDEAVSDVVVFIFDLCLQGYTPGSIARKLDEMGILTPYQYKRSIGMDYNSGFCTKPDSPWSQTTVESILHNDIYTGTMVQGKKRKINYKVKTVVDMPREDWFIVENTHEAIISKNIFDAAQRVLAFKSRSARDSEKSSLFAGFLKCGDCGKNMTRRFIKKKNRRYPYYYCPAVKDKTCTLHHTSEKLLTETVLEIIRNDLALLADSLELIRNDKTKNLSREKVLEKQVREQKREMRKYKKMRSNLVEDLENGLISKDEFEDLEGTFNVKIERLQKSIEENMQKLETQVEIPESNWIEEYLQYRDIKELDRRILTTLVDKIIVYDKSHIEVVFSHKEEMDDIFRNANSKEVEA